jgi:hypothetical protein
VHGPRDCVPADLLDGVRPGRCVLIHYDNAGAALGKSAGGFAPDAPAAARHERDPAV